MVRWCSCFFRLMRYTILLIHAGIAGVSESSLLYYYYDIINIVKEVRKLRIDEGCIFCNKPTTKHHNCDVCHDCKAVMRSPSTSEEDFFAEIKACINSIQSFLENNRETLYMIDSKHLNQEYLTPEEQKITDFCMAFQLCKVDLEHKLSRPIRIDDRGFRKNIYTLLELSDEFPQIFRHECHTMSI